MAQPIDLPCGVRLHNRLAKAAMSESLGDRRNAPTGGLGTLYREWSLGGAGLLITGNVMIDRRALGEPANVVVEDHRDLDALRTWASSSSETNASIWMQLNHPGRQTPRWLVAEPVAPSAVAVAGSGRAFATPRALTGGEVLEIVARFARTARIAQEAGFAGVQVHGAHGYLVSQFLSARVNRRDDEWGGDPERRRRFLLEVVRAIRAAVGPAFPIGVKLNSSDFQKGGLDPDESQRVAMELERAGIDLLEVSGGTYERAAMMGGPSLPAERESTRRREAYFLEYARELRSTLTIPLMLTGGFRSGEAMRAAVESGDVDLVGLARPMTVAPDLPRRLLAGDIAGSDVRAISTPLRRMDGLADILWHTQQIHRLAAGRPPAPRRSVARAMAQAALTNGAATFRRVRA